MRHLCTLVLTALALGCGHSSETSSQPLSGNVAGASFSVVGARTSTVDGNTVLTLVNVPSSCQAPATPSDGQISLEITLPKALLVPGSHPIGANGVTAGVTKMRKSGADPITFDAIGLTSGTLDLQKVDQEIAGSLSVATSRLSLTGVFRAPICP